jgi:hypothetical protein
MRKKGDRAVRVVVDSQHHVAFISGIEIETAKAAIAINLANYIPVPPGTAEPPDFTGDPSQFADFISRHFPVTGRRFPGDRFAPLRQVVEKPSPVGWGFQRKMSRAPFVSHPFAMVYTDEWRATPISFYREIVRLGKLLRAASVVIDAVAQLKDERPQLRICDCGKLFVPGRKDDRTCSETCADRIRKAKWWKTTQAQRDRYKKNRVRKENEREKQRKAR